MPGPASWPTRSRTARRPRWRPRRPRCWRRIGGSGVKVFLLDNYDSFTYNLVPAAGSHRRRCQRRAQRPGHRGRGRRDGARRHRHLAGPVAARAGGDQRGARAARSGRQCRRSACAWATRPSASRTARRSSASRRSTARRWPVHHAGSGVVRGSPLAVRRRPLPLAGRGARRAAGRARGHRLVRRRRDHGHAPPRRTRSRAFQFHPESILTDDGEALVAGFLRRAAAVPAR